MMKLTLVIQARCKYSMQLRIKICLKGPRIVSSYTEKLFGSRNLEKVSKPALAVNTFTLNRSRKYISLSGVLCLKLISKNLSRKGYL